MKKILFTALGTIMLLVLAACGNNSNENSTQTNNTVPQVNETEVLSNETAEQKGETVEQSNETAEQSNDTTEKTNEAAEQNSETASTQDTSSSKSTTPTEDITPVASSLEAPAKIGDWIETKRYSATDKADHTVYYRIKDIIRYNDEVQAALDAYNNADHLRKFEPIESDDLEYCLIKYDVFFPADYPENDWGITTVDIRFSIESPTGGGIKANGMSYIGLSSVYDISVKPEINEFYAGQTFEDGMATFAMVKGVSDYLVETSYSDENDQIVAAYVEGK